MIALLSSILAVCMAVGVMFLRFKARKAGNEKENYIAANFMSTGATMYFYQSFD